MGCDNDDLIGYVHAHEPATLILFCAGLVWLEAFGSKRKTKYDNAAGSYAALFFEKISFKFLSQYLTIISMNS